MDQNECKSLELKHINLTVYEKYEKNFLKNKMKQDEGLSLTFVRWSHRKKKFCLMAYWFLCKDLITRLIKFINV